KRHRRVGRASRNIFLRFLWYFQWSKTSTGPSRTHKEITTPAFLGAVGLVLKILKISLIWQNRKPRAHRDTRLTLDTDQFATKTFLNIN
ncbi:MAG: hypothetical protein COA69_11640, partial [Robiginitomaculum sp.]